MSENSQNFSAFSDDELRKLKLLEDLKINNKLLVLESECIESCEEYGTARASSKKYKEFTEENLLENIEMFKKKIREFLAVESNDDIFNDFRYLFKQSKLTEFLFEFCVECEFGYGSVFAKVIENILIDYKKKKNLIQNRNHDRDYDHLTILNILLVIFKNQFHADLNKLYFSFKVEPEQYPIKNSDEQVFEKRRKFFENNEYMKILERIFKHPKYNMKNFFYNSTQKIIDLNLLNEIELIFDICTIKFNDDTNLYIVLPLQIKIKGYLENDKVEDVSQASESHGQGFFSHFFEKNHPMYKIRKLDEDKLLSHDLVYNVLHNQWYILGNLFYNLEFLLYTSFVIFYSLNSLQISKENSYPLEFRWVCLSIIIVVIIIEIGELKLLKVYYFYLFSKIFEVINFFLVIVSISISEDNLPRKSNFYSLSLLSTYMCLIFRCEKLILLGTYIYTLRKILLKSFKVLPIVFVMYFGFYVSLRTRSRFLTEPGQENDNKEITFTNGFLSLSLIKLSEMLLGNFQPEEFGLGTEGATEETFINFILINTMIYFMPVFLFNLFIGIAVEEVSELLKKGQIHLIKIRIDYMIKIFYFISFFNLQKCFTSYFHPEYIWHIKRRKRRPIYNFRKYFLLMSNKLSNSRWSATYELKFGRNKKIKDNKKLEKINP